MQQKQGKEFQFEDYNYEEYLIKLLPRGKRKTTAQISSWGGRFRFAFWKPREKNNGKKLNDVMILSKKRE